MTVKFSSAADGLELERSIATGLAIDPDEDVTVQSDKDDSDINVLVKRFGLTTDTFELASNLAYYGDFTDLRDLPTTLNAVRESQEAFDALPSRLRERFANSPIHLLDFLNNPSNATEAAELGLLTPEAAQAILRPVPRVTDKELAPDPSVASAAK